MSIHAIIYLMMEARDRAIERAIQDERSWSNGEKLKRGPLMRLTEAGELEELTEDNQLESPRHQRHH
jgi:hypothetical protein